MTQPVRFDDLTLEFLQQCLIKKGLEGADLKGFELTEVPEPGQAAAMTFIDLQHTSPNLPRRLIAKQKTEFVAAAEYVEKLGAASREVAFYDNIGKACLMDIPESYHGHYDRKSGEFLLIMEDRTGPPPGDWVTANIDQARSLIDGLKAMHSKWWEDEAIINADWTAKFSSQTGSMLQVMHETFQSCALEFNEVFKDDIDEHFAECVVKAYEKPRLLTAFDSMSKTLVHGDYHYKNALFPVDQPAVVFDWQTAGYGPASIDLARTFIFLGEDNANIHTVALLDNYHSAITSAGISYSRDQLSEDMSLGFIYNLWLSVAALMETDIHIIRDVIAAQGSTLQELCGTMSSHIARGGSLEFMESY